MKSGRESRRYPAAPTICGACERQFLSGGLVAERDGIREPILGLDVYKPPRGVNGIRAIFLRRNRAAVRCNH